MPPRRPLAPASRRSGGARAGLTLLELMVGLAVMGLVLALGAARLEPPAPAADGDLASAIRATRALAVQRGEALTMRVEPDGRWRVTGDARPDAPAVLESRLAAATGVSLVLRVGSTGACVPEGALGVRWDPVNCAPFDAARAVASP